MNLVVRRPQHVIIVKRLLKMTRHVHLLKIIMTVITTVLPNLIVLVNVVVMYLIQMEMACVMI